MRVKLTDLWLDSYQGQTRNDRAFGYVGTELEYEDEDGEERQYCGWFFTWPREEPGIATFRERDAVIASLDRDETMSGSDAIPIRLAEKKLLSHLRKRFPRLRRRAVDAD